MLAIELALLGWTVAGLIWWIVAYRLLGESSEPPQPALTETLPTLTVFKSLAPTTTAEERQRLAAAIETFLTQLEAGVQLIIGVEGEDHTGWEPIFERWRVMHVTGEILIQTLSPPPPGANPKIAKLEALAPRAHGECWMWSDADILAPPGLLRQLRREIAGPEIGAVTCAYVVRAPARQAGMLDALFVNLEFLPGALLLGRRGRLEFAFGAVVLFRAVDFHARVSWSALRFVLADDYELGRRLGRVRLSRCTVETLALAVSWREALSHYYRWQKTIRWCRPGGYAALLAILPFLGWLAAVLACPSVGVLWAGLGWVWISETVFAGMAFGRLKCKLPALAWLSFLAWPTLRAFTWVAVWLPFSVRWGEGREAWRKAHRNAAVREYRGPADQRD